ncbi:MAG: putative 3-methyladenine DNA glycosylase [Haliscomenobacter sp.]|jgi:DNA-3-methyladenine glycosylase|nr:putative 3-methyladenine DNA glycosylase [Haliscomenobacter sp.]
MVSDRLPQSFYLGEDVVFLAKALLGNVLVTEFNGQRSAGRIVETEAYRGPDDRACHAFNNRRTPRTEVMFGPGGHAYVYLCYGIHHLFNIVTGPEDAAHAVLIRGVEPLDNLALMLERRHLTKPAPPLTAGPGALAQALGIRTIHSGLPLFAPESPIWLEDRGLTPSPESIVAGTRVGVEPAGTCALRPWRFSIKGSPWVSRAKGAPTP